jgi:lipoate---protein ligase
MKYLDLSLPAPAQNLACDEALLDACESGGAEVLRFWESPCHFVVLGYANRAACEVNLEACRACNVPVLRRCSGGGTVVQGPGCLNYSLVLRIDETGPLATIHGTNQFILNRQRQVMSALLGRPVEIQGMTDLTVGGLKFSGNAQRRKRRSVLYHGTFLIGFDLALIERFLRMPSKQPDYRNGRAHAAFLTNLDTTRERIQEALRSAWNVTSELTDPPKFAALEKERYARAEWNGKF